MGKCMFDPDDILIVYETTESIWDRESESHKPQVRTRIRLKGLSVDWWFGWSMSLKEWLVELKALGRCKVSAPEPIPEPVPESFMLTGE
jgi:hypothetical protein